MTWQFDLHEDFDGVLQQAREELTVDKGWTVGPLIELKEGARVADFARGDETVVISKLPIDPGVTNVGVSRNPTWEDHVLWFVSGRREYR
jgi:hypothetical protein